MASRIKKKQTAKRFEGTLLTENNQLTHTGLCKTVSQAAGFPRAKHAMSHKNSTSRELASLLHSPLHTTDGPTDAHVHPQA
jgi:hypothetical protein